MPNTEIVLHYWPTPNGWKISIALEEMDLAYTPNYIDISAGAQYDPAYLNVAPHNRIPAITDPDGPDGMPVSIFESGAILLYLARKTGRFAGQTARERIAVEQWLMWQMASVGPMFGQAHHFLSYAPDLDPPQVLPYAQDRYRREVARLYAILERQLAVKTFVAGDFVSIADMAIWPWASLWQRQQQSIDDKPHVARWLAALAERPGFARGRALGAERRQDGKLDARAQEILFRR